MKSKWLLSMLGVAAMSASAMAQVAPEKAPRASDNSPRYEVFAGWGYTSINQVSQSRSGLQGISLSVTRDFGRYFGVTAQGGHYAWSVSSSNSGDPSVDMFLVGPVLRAPLYDKLSGYVHGLIGVVHTGNVVIEPSASFAGGLGLGMDYAMSPRVSLRLQGDDIGSAFTVVPYESGYSTHTRWNGGASFGVVYKF